MNNIMLEGLCQQINENSSSSVAEFGPIILPLVKKLYLDSFIGQIADLTPLKSPVGKIPCLFSTYSGTDSSAETNTHPDNSFFITVDGDYSAWIADINTTLFTISGSNFIIRHVEYDKETKSAGVTIGNDYTKILISRESGNYIPIKGDLFNTRTITYSTFNRAAIKKMFRRYSGAFVYGNDSNVDVKNISFEVRTEDVRTVSRKLKTKFSQEQLEDYLSIYKEKAYELAGNYMANEIRQEIDKEFISYLKFIATLSLPSPMPTFKIADGLNNTPKDATLDLTASYGSDQSGSLQDVSYDLISNIFLTAEQIVKDTKRNRTIFILADPITCAFLQTNAFHTTEQRDNNPYRIDTIGKYPLYCDLFADVSEHYVLVGYQTSTNEQDGDAGIFYAPYTTNIYQTTDVNMKEHMLYLDRYAIARHPQDTGNLDKNDIWNIKNAGNSDFFKMFFVEYGNLKNFGNNTSIKAFN